MTYIYIHGGAMFWGYVLSREILPMDEKVIDVAGINDGKGQGSREKPEK